MIICVLGEGGVKQVCAALALSYTFNWRHFCPGWVETLVSGLGAWPSCNKALTLDLPSPPSVKMGLVHSPAIWTFLFQHRC